MRKVESLASGRYKVRFRIGGADGRQTSETFDRRKDAVEFAKWLDALGPQGALDRLYEGEQDKAVPTMDELAADHIRLLTGIEPGTRLRYQRLWDRTWSPVLGRVPAHRLTSDDVRAAVNHLSLRYSEKSLKNQRGLLAGVCGRAVELGYQHKVLTKGVRISRGTAEGHEAEEMVLLAPSEWPLLYAAMTPHYQSLIRFLVGTGARWGEAVALRVSEVNLTHANVKLIRALKDSPDGKRYVGVTKTRKSKRTIALPAEVVDDLAPLLRHKAASDLVFTAPRGGMIAHRTFWSDHWRPALWRAQHCPKHTDPACRCGTAHPKRCTVHDAPPPPCGCDGTLRQSPRIHDLRHTHASWLLGRGVPLNVVQARLGHESIQTTVDTYGHLMPDAHLLASRAAEMAFSEAPRELG